MPTTFPVSFDSFVNPVSGQPLNNPNQALLITNLNDAVAALQAKVGINLSATTTSLDYQIRHVVQSVTAGSNVTVDNTDPTHPIVSATGGAGSGIASIGAGANISVNNAVPTAPVISVTGVVKGVNAGTGVSVDNTDPTHPIISSAGTGGSATVYNVMDYGAAGTGLVDDTAPIQNAIGDAEVNGGTVFFPAGTYYISSSLALTSPGVVLQGINQADFAAEGSYITTNSGFSGAGIVSIASSSVGVNGLSLNGNSTTAAISITGTSSVGYSGVTLKNLAITNLGGITAAYLTESIMEDITFLNWTNTYGFSLQNCSDVTLNRCLSNPVSAGGGYAYFAYNSTRLTLNNLEVLGNPAYCLYAGNTTHSTVANFRANGTSTDYVHLDGCNNWSFVSTDFTGTGRCFNIINGSYNVNITDSSLYSSGANVIALNGTSTNVYNIGITNSTLTQGVSSTSNLISMTGNTYTITVSGNRLITQGSNLAISDASTNTSRHCAYVGNILSPGGTGAMSISTTTNVVTDGNAGYPSQINTVAVSTTAPSAGQTLVATSGSAATWQTPASGSGVVTSITGTGQIQVTNGTSATPSITTTVPLVQAITAGTNITIGGTATNPIINSSGGGGGSAKGALAVSAPSSSPAAINTGTYQSVRYYAMANGVNVTTTGSPADGDTLEISFAQTTGTPFTITWDPIFQSSYYVTLPGSTLANNRMDVGFIWNATDSKWRCVAVS